MLTETQLNYLKVKAWDSLAEWVWDLEMTGNKEKDYMDCHDFVQNFQAIDNFMQTLIKKEEA